MSFPADAAYRDCPWCQTKSIAMEVIHPNYATTSSGGSQREWTWLSCPRCRGVVSVESTFNMNPGQVVSVVPNAVSGAEVKHLPADVAEYYNNALTVLNAGVPSSAAVELRRTLEAAAKHNDITVTPLVKAIEKMVDEGLVTKSFSSVLGHIRKIGNQGAHAADENISENEVRVALNFTTQILRNLFEVPKELELLNEALPAADNTTPQIDSKDVVL